MFYSYVMIAAVQVRKSDDPRHAMLPISPFLSFFSGMQRISGYVRPRMIVVISDVHGGAAGGGRRGPPLWLNC